MIRSGSLRSLGDNSLREDAQTPVSDSRSATPSATVDDDGTEPMDMASPVQDTILSIYGHTVEAHTIPLPPSPITRSPNSEPQSPSSGGMQRVEALEEALHTARREVDEREIVLGVLRRNILAIQMTLPYSVSDHEPNSIAQNEHSTNDIGGT